jgi:hypothetical protein
MLPRMMGAPSRRGMVFASLSSSAETSVSQQAKEEALWSSTIRRNRNNRRSIKTGSLGLSPS